MPLEVYRRGRLWWVKGRVEHLGRPITDYYRRSTGSSTEAGAREWATIETERAIRRHLVGDEADEITLADALVMYPAKPAEARFLARIIEVVPDLAQRRVSTILPREVRDLGGIVYPQASTDTWWRQVVVPMRAVINNANDHGRCAPIRIKGYSAQERAAQDDRRGRESRRERVPATREWVASFVACADPYNAALVEFLFETGCRIGEAVILTPEHLDLQRGRFWWPGAKGHPAQWVAISTEMVVTLANLPPRRPHDRRSGKKLAPRVFGYADRGGPRKAWRTICAAAGIPYRSPHALRHGFYTELRVRQGLDPITAAKAGRWSDPTLPDRVYAHSDLDERAIRAAIRTGRVHPVDQEAVRKLKKKEK